MEIKVYYLHHSYTVYCYIISISTVDKYAPDEEFTEKSEEVKVTAREIETVKANFKKPHWTWKLPASLREPITVNIYLCSY